MKKHMLIGILIFPLIMISCTSEENIEDVAIDKKDNFQKPGMILSGPENASNPYDSIGRLHNEVLEIYLSTHSDNSLSENTSTEDIMAQVQLIACSGTINIVQDCSSSFAYNTINTIVTNPENSTASIIDNSILTSQGKADLRILIDSLAEIDDESYQDINEFIISYESDILSSNVLNNQDKRIILTTSSIVRHSVYYEEIRDRDWDSSVGNFIGGTVGALNSSLSPVTMALVTGLRCRNSTGN